MRRVVVTGLGLVTPLGADVETSWENIIASKSGAGPITKFDASDQKCRIACEVKPADHEYGFDANKRADYKIQRQVDPFIIFGLDAAGQAIEDAGLTDMDETTRLRAGVSIGSGIGGLPGIESESLVLLEEYEHAKARGAKIYAELVGYGLSGDAYHVTAPHPEGSGGFRAMEMALKRSGMQPSDIDYINAHGTSTPLGDELELGAVRRLFGNAIANVSMSSTKSAIGHLLGGAGAVESIFCILAMRDQVVPPTLNLDNPSEMCEGVDLVPHKSKKRPVRAVLNNSFGFGGTNASLIMKAV